MTLLTISDVPIEVEYVVTGGPTVGPWTIPFEFFVEEDIVVTEYDTNGDLVATYGHNNGGTVVPGNKAVDGGIRIGAAWQPDAPGHNDGTLKIRRSTVIDRSTNFSENGPFDIGELNDQLNKIIGIAQELDAQKDKYINLPEDSIGTTPWDLEGRAACNAGESAADNCLTTNRQMDASGPNWLYDDNVEAAIGASEIFSTIVGEAGIPIEGRDSDKVMDLTTHFFCFIQNRGGSEAEFILRYRYHIDCYSQVVKIASSDYRVKVPALSAIPFSFMDIEQDLNYDGGDCTVAVYIDIKPVGINSENLYTQWRNLSVNTSEPR